jgi:hypothetical protein
VTKTGDGSSRQFRWETVTVCSLFWRPSRRSQGSDQGSMTKAAHISIGDILVLSCTAHRTVLVLRAYFDESGHSAQSQFVSVGGCIASVEAWRAFEANWERKLHHYGIACFHVKNFESSSGEFRNWNNPQHSLHCRSNRNHE